MVICAYVCPDCGSESRYTLPSELVGVTLVCPECGEDQVLSHVVSTERWYE